MLTFDIAWLLLPTAPQRLLSQLLQPAPQLLALTTTPQATVPTVTIAAAFTFSPTAGTTLARVIRSLLGGMKEDETISGTLVKGRWGCKKAWVGIHLVLLWAAAVPFTFEPWWMWLCFLSQLCSWYLADSWFSLFWPDSLLDLLDLFSSFLCILLKIYLLLAVLGLRCCTFSSCGDWGLLCSWGTQASHLQWFLLLQSTGSRAQTWWFGAWA